MSDVIMSLTLEVNNKQTEFFAEVEEGEIQLAKTIQMMNTVAIGETKNKGRGVSINYIIPAAVEEQIDWSKVKGGKIALNYDNGQRSVYSSAYVLKIGSKTTKADGDAQTQKIEIYSKNWKME